MTDDSDDLDDHQDISAQKAAEVRRRHLHGFLPNRTALLRRQEELNKPILAAPPEAWPEPAGTARNHAQLSASGAAAQDPAPKELIAHVLDDLMRS